MAASSPPPTWASLERDKKEEEDSELFEKLERELDDELPISGFDMGEYRQKRMAQLREE